MASSVTARALHAEHADAICKALRDIARTLGTDSVHGQRPADFSEQRAALAASDCGPRLLALARHADAVIRELSADALAAWGDDDARAALLQMVGDEVVEVRASAVGGLEHWPQHREVVETLLIAIEDSKWLVRMRAARALAGVAGDEADRALIAALLDSEPFVRSTAADALAQRPASQVLPRLRRLLDHPLPQLFDGAFDLIGQLGEEEDAVFLEKVGRWTNLSQPGPVKSRARAAARAIRGRLKRGRG